jgi:dolichol-phosphate mannosyltransferase
VRGIALGRLSVVVPIYECASCLWELHARLTAALEGLAESYELVFVDDRSTDGAWAIVEELSARDPHVRGLRLSRNFGQAAALSAGLEHAGGEWILLMDCDLQDRPEDIARVVAAAPGHDIVFTRRLNRGQSLFRRIAGRAYFRLRNAVLGIDDERNLGSMILLSRKVADAYARLGERERQHALLLWWIGFERAFVDVEHAPRHSGRSAYTFKTLVGVGLEGLFLQSSRLLHWIVYAGLAVAVGGFALAGVAIVQYLSVETVPGWTSTVVVELILGGTILVSLGVAALYVGRVFDETKGRPLYIVDAEVGTRADAP